MPRRSLSDQQTDPLTQRPGRDRSWETEQRRKGFVSYRGVPPELQEELKAIAAEHGVTVGDIARRFLEYGRDAYESGALELEPVLVSKRFSLYPPEA